MGRKLSGTYLFSEVPPELQGSLVTVLRYKGQPPSEYVAQIMSVGCTVLHMPFVRDRDTWFMRAYDLDSPEGIEVYIGGIINRFKSESSTQQEAEVVYYQYFQEKGKYLNDNYKKSHDSGQLTKRKPSNISDFRKGDKTKKFYGEQTTSAEDDLESLLGITKTESPTGPKYIVEGDYVSGRGEESADDSVRAASIPPHRRADMAGRTPEAYLKALMRSKG